MRKGFHCGYKKTNHVKEKYDNLMQQAEISKEIQKLEYQILCLKESIETYDMTFSEADECPYSKEDLQEILEEKEAKLKRLQKNRRY